MEGPGAHWIYPKSKVVLEERGMHTLEDYIMVYQQTIAVYVGDHPILTESRQGEQKRGAVPHCWL